jgi:hypothetical protein
MIHMPGLGACITRYMHPSKGRYSFENEIISKFVRNGRRKFVGCESILQKGVWMSIILATRWK